MHGGWSWPSAEEAQEVADAAVPRERIGEATVACDRVTVASAVPLAPDVARVRELPHDSMRGSLGDSDLIADLSKPDVGVARDAEQHLSVVAEKGPVGHGSEVSGLGES
jgi:hypothetical protein